MSTPLEQPSDLVLETPAVTGSEVRTRYGRAVRAPVRYEPVEQVEDDYGSDDYDEDESAVGSGIEYSDTELEDDDDTDLDGFVVPDRDESDESDNGSGTDTGSDTSSRVLPSVARRGPASRAAPAGDGVVRPRISAAKVPDRGKKV